MPQQDRLTIREFQPGDLQQVAAIAARSFKHEFNKIAPLPANKLPDFSIKAGFIYPQPFNGYIVAEVNSQVVAVMILKWLHQDRPQMKPKTLDVIGYGFLAALKLFVFRHMPREKILEKECHIEIIAVKPEARCRNIASRLLDFGRDLACKQGFEKFSLHVASSNKAALNIYKRAGFRLADTKKGFFSRLLASVDEWYYMIKDISPASEPKESETKKMISIRREMPEDIEAIGYVNEQAFGRKQEKELVGKLRQHGKLTLSLVAVEEGKIVGHIAFSLVTVESDTDSFDAITIAPLAVLPERQKQGIGTRLVDASLKQCRQLGYEVVVAVGHPQYYPRFGFIMAKQKGISCEFEAPPEAFMLLELQPDALAGRTGMVKFQPEFREAVQSGQEL